MKLELINTFIRRFIKLFFFFFFFFLPALLNFCKETADYEKTLTRNQIELRSIILPLASMPQRILVFSNQLMPLARDVKLSLLTSCLIVLQH
ncbi:hypothetical protein QG37_05695 [Candidozyma auris]|uniref:Uncharacterized protein n=1 Tax=Candidozyma auris TaxID=498019 RepID=A0A0L0NT35_CANAR|nr:hypothetical protein QG37_05695 [[Candida] auris]